MIERVRREETWHRTAKDAYPDPYKIMRIQFPVVEELRDTPRETWPQPDALPTALGYLAETFEDAGWPDLARRTYYEMLELRREAGPSEDLRRVLTALRTNLIRQELYEEALPVALEGHALAAQLAVPGRYNTVVANEARYWITDLLGKLGRHAEAARNAEEAVAELREQKPVKDGPPPGYSLAHAQLEYAQRLATIGDLERAADSAAEAAAFWRQHSWEQAVRLYTVLDELSTLQLRLGRFEDARASHAEAVAVIRQRAERKKEQEFLSHLAGALNNHANRLHDMGLDAEAIEAAQESADRYRELAANAEGRAMVMKTELRAALALIGLASRLHDVRRLDESFAASDEAIALATRYADKELGRRELARALTNRASALITRRAWAEAAEAAAKGLELYQTAHGKAMARNTFALASAHAGQHDVALEASLQSVAEYREWHAADPDGYAYLLADALTDHARIRLLRAERAEAEAAITESLPLHEELAAANPGRYQRELDHARSVAAQI
ncbi:hypothetical protein SK803_08090 [Lentzea sp. BCCO 10_0856]|uniref:Tetratricopeptide repeat-containing protein n=1 Tax=Lentzea miocenica TaxID=3095431 RepID=A0ABU4SW60_9PSEU|nr:hypothetical protein [Lentzea sp. BCCO 10_0856]MDX8030167.1 hypothetical protein [Lentzea sp. BCCO 10_0856]